MARIGFSGELGKERGKEAIKVLFLHISKIEVIIGHRGQSSGTLAFDFLDDCRTRWEYK
jgi:hypothetical protein